MESIAEFMKKELVEYIVQELNKGNSLNEIKKALLKAGHNQDLIEKATSILKKNSFNLTRAIAEPVNFNSLQRIMYYDLLNSLIKYIEYHLSQGRSLNEITGILFRYGHTRETVNAAIEAVENKDPLKRIKREEPKMFHKIAYRLAFPGCLFLLVLLMFYVSISANDTMLRVFVGFSPSLFLVIAAHLILQYISDKQKYYLLLLPILSSIGFYYTATEGGFVIFENMNIQKISVLNAFIGLLFASIFMYVKQYYPEAKPLTRNMEKKTDEEKTEKKYIPIKSKLYPLPLK